VTSASADFNQDNSVDTDDLSLWQTGFGTLVGATHDNGDANGDFAIDGDDFLAWQQQFTGEPSSLTLVDAVPEPATVTSLVIALLCMTSARRCVVNRR
jgi:hypothetical protein